MTHPGSGWQELVDRLYTDRRFDFFQTGHSYHHPEDLDVLFNHKHRHENSASIWCDLLLRNEQFTSRALCECCGFVYWIKPLDVTAQEYRGIMDTETAYAFRLQGLNLYLRRTPRALCNPLANGNMVLDSIFSRKNDIVTRK